jgi:hypothetical protein
MQIAIIGAGNVGRALAASLTRAGHDVTITATHSEHAVEAASETGATAVVGNTEAAQAAELVVLAIPEQAHDQVARELAPAVAGKVIVDVSNRPTPSPDGAPTSIAEELQGKLPNAKVVKAFNTAFASRQANPSVGGIAPDGFVAGDDAQAKQAVLDVVESVGFRPVDAGSLSSARTLEGMAWLNIQRNIAGGTWQDAWVLVGPETVQTADADRHN